MNMKNIGIALFVILCFVAYVVSEANDAKERGKQERAYIEHKEEYYKEREEQGEQARITDLYDGAITYEDILCEPHSYEGDTVEVYGPIADISLLNESAGSPSFIDIGDAYPSANRFSVVIWVENYDIVFNELDLNVGDTIFVYGTIEMYNGVPQIEVTEPYQIEIL